MVCIRKENGRWVKYTTNFAIKGGGFLVLPDELIPEFDSYLPYVEIVSENGIVTSMSAGVVPEPVPVPDPEPTAQDDTDAMIVDHEYRLTMLELGVTE